MPIFKRFVKSEKKNPLQVDIAHCTCRKQIRLYIHTHICILLNFSSFEYAVVKPKHTIL